MNVISLYGSVALEKIWCDDCKTNTFVRNGKTVCCGTPVNGIPTEYVREFESPTRRRELSKTAKARVMEAQDGKCFYCDQEIGSVKHRHGRPVTLLVHYDHQIPFAYSGDCHEYNFVAACHVCNHIKSSKVFRDIEEAKSCLTVERKAKGYDF